MRDTCDSLVTEMEEVKAGGEDTQELEQELAAHKDFAQTGYKTFHHDQLLSQKSWEKQSEIMCLQTIMRNCCTCSCSKSCIQTSL